MTAWYNEPDEEKAAWLEELIRNNLIAPGVVDRRSITDVRADELAGFVQCHFFAGIGGWSYSLRGAGWPDDRSVWTGSCPCGPFSSVGELERFSDERHLWPDWVHLIRQRKPAIVFGEQVAAATEWVRLVRSDMETLGYALGAVPIEAASAGADHFRDRWWFVAERAMVDGVGPRLERYTGHDDLWARREGEAGSVASSGIQFDVYQCVDGQRRRAESGLPLLVDGIPEIVGIVRGFGDAIDPRPAIEFIGAYMDICKNNIDNGLVGSRIAT